MIGIRIYIIDIEITIGIVIELEIGLEIVIGVEV